MYTLFLPYRCYRILDCFDEYFHFHPCWDLISKSYFLDSNVIFSKNIGHVTCTALHISLKLWANQGLSRPPATCFRKKKFDICWEQISWRIQLFFRLFSGIIWLTMVYIDPLKELICSFHEINQSVMSKSLKTTKPIYHHLRKSEHEAIKENP